MWSEKQLAGTCTDSEGFVTVKGRSTHTTLLYDQPWIFFLLPRVSVSYFSHAGVTRSSSTSSSTANGWKPNFHPLPLPWGAATSLFSRSHSLSLSLRMYPNQKANYHFPVGVKLKKFRLPLIISPHKAK